MKFLIEILYLLVIVVHRKLYGLPTVTYLPTDKSMKLSYRVNERDYIFISTQYIYTVINDGFLKYRSKTYFYKVKLLTNSPSLEDGTTKNYTTMCPSFLKNTTYPHRLAIHAHFKLMVTGK